MPNRAIIVHGWGGDPDTAGFAWFRQELEQNGFTVEIPVMPDPEEPKIEPWVQKLAETVGEPNEHTYLIGHSIGCQTTMRYLTDLNKNQKVGGAVFIAGWFKLKNLEDEEITAIAEPWQATPIDTTKVKHSVKAVSVFLSDNDPYDAVDENKQRFEQELGATVTVMPNHGHFGGDNLTELPAARDAVLKQAGLI